MIGYDIVRQPLLTEKTNLLREQYNQFSFEVAPHANRIEIKRSVESIFKVRVKSVRTMNYKGKIKRKGRIEGRRKNWKKAVVRLYPGERIEFFEGA